MGNSQNALTFEQLQKLQADIICNTDRQKLSPTIRFDQTDGANFIAIADPNYDLDKIKSPDEILTSEKIRIAFNYPLRNEVIFEFNDGPYSRRELAKIICATYANIYREEEESTTIAPGCAGPKICNRNATNGKYGIWGHDIDNLMLHTVYIEEDDFGTIYRLGIDS